MYSATDNDCWITTKKCFIITIVHDIVVFITKQIIIYNIIYLQTLLADRLSSVYSLFSDYRPMTYQSITDLTYAR